MTLIVGSTTIPETAGNLKVGSTNITSVVCNGVEVWSTISIPIPPSPPAVPGFTVTPASSAQYIDSFTSLKFTAAGGSTSVTSYQYNEQDWSIVIRVCTDSDGNVLVANSSGVGVVTINNYVAGMVWFEPYNLKYNTFKSSSYTNVSTVSNLYYRDITLTSTTTYNTRYNNWCGNYVFYRYSQNAYATICPVKSYQNLTILTNKSTNNSVNAWTCTTTLGTSSSNTGNVGTTASLYTESATAYLVTAWAFARIGSTNVDLANNTEYGNIQRWSEITLTKI
jgi:hypothetical protein